MCNVPNNTSIGALRSDDDGDECEVCNGNYDGYRRFVVKLF